RKGHHEAAIRRFLAGKELTDRTIGAAPLREKLERRLHSSKRLQLAGELKKTIRLMRFHALQENPSSRLAYVLEASGRNVWAQRDLLRDRSSGNGEPGFERDLDDELQELVLLWGELQLRLAPATHKERVRAEIARTIEQAEQIYGVT